MQAIAARALGARPLYNLLAVAIQGTLEAYALQRSTHLVGQVAALQICAVWDVRIALIVPIALIVRIALIVPIALIAPIAQGVALLAPQLAPLSSALEFAQRSALKYALDVRSTAPIPALIVDHSTGLDVLRTALQQN